MTQVAILVKYKNLCLHISSTNYQYLQKHRRGPSEVLKKHLRNWIKTEHYQGMHAQYLVKLLYVLLMLHVCMTTVAVEHI